MIQRPLYRVLYPDGGLDNVDHAGELERVTELRRVPTREQETPAHAITDLVV